MARGRGKVSFQSLPELNSTNSDWIFADGGAAVALSLKVLDTTDTWDISSHSRRVLAQELVDVVAAMLKAGSYFTAVETYRRYKYIVTAIIRKIENDKNFRHIDSLKKIDLAFLNAIDTAENTTTDYANINVMVIILRAARRFFPLSIAEDLRPSASGDRLACVSDFPKPSGRPRDPYSPYVTQQLKEAAIREMREAIARIDRGIKDIERIGAAIAAGEKISPTDGALYALSRTGVVQADEYYRDLRRAGINRVAPPSISSAQARALASNIAWSERDRDVERAWHLPIGTIYRLFNGRDGFIELVEEYEGRWLDLYVRELKHKRNQREVVTDTYRSEADYSRGCLLREGAAHMSLVRARHQVERRRVVLSRWADTGIPREKIGTVNFRKGSIDNWADNDLGIEPLSLSAENRRVISACCADDMKVIESSVRILQEIYPRLFCARHITNLYRKIDVLERALVDGQFSEIALTDFTLRGFCNWVDLSRNIHKTNKVRATKTDPQYGEVIKSAIQLLKAVNLRRRELGLAEGRKALYVRLHSELSPGVAGAKICPTSDELAAFFIFFGLTCQIDNASLRMIKADCLKNENAGYVDIEYIKNRPKPVTKVAREQDGSLTSPGGVIRSVLSITKVAREALKLSCNADAVYLWLCFYPTGFRRCRFNSAKAPQWKLFCERNEIWDDDGRRVRSLQPSRFRKTVKATKYKKYHGDILAITDDHGFVVARDHYADVPALEQVHNDTITRGLKRALEDVTCIVLDEDNDEVATDLAGIAEVSLETATKVVSGGEDSWLAGCLSFTNGPYGPPGEPCPKVFTGCINCPCSVFFKRKLPNIIRYRNWLADRRLVVGDEVWNAKYRIDYLRIETQILARFEPEDVRIAEESVAADADSDEGKLFIPSWIQDAV